jgi:hypothetical protein
MLEWKPKLVVLIAVLVIVAALLSLMQVTGLISTDITMYSW